MTLQQLRDAGLEPDRRFVDAYLRATLETLREIRQQTGVNNS